ncbi:pyridoxal phosphate-dependent aminotransferase [bacterium]|nr:pyridoxal phosphate-dependent aminotransferase [bacterium]
MSFNTIKYMEWAKTHYKNLDSSILDFSISGMPPPADNLLELGIDFHELTLARDNSYGYKPLREAIAARYGVDYEQVLPTIGSSMGNFIFYASIHRPGKSILLESPVYECLKGPIEGFNMKAIPLPRYESRAWQFDVDEAVALAEEHDALAIVLTNPHNPSGVFTEESTIQELAEKMGDRWLLVDEVYREWVPDQRGRTSAGRHPRIVVTSSLTKVWGLGQLRVGWMIAPKEFIHRSQHTYDHMAVIHPIEADWLGHQLFAKPGLLDKIRENMLRKISESREIVDSFLEKHRELGVESQMPDSGAVALWQFRDNDGDQLANKLEKEAGITVVPGSFFAANDHVRVSWTNTAAHIDKVLDRFSKWIIKQA